MKTMDRIYSHALEHFSQFGYEGASVREITLAAQVTKPTLYYYFRSKEDLYRKLLQSCMDKVYPALESATQGQGDACERLLNVLHVFKSLCEKCRSEVKFVYLVSSAPTHSVPSLEVGEFQRRMLILIQNLVNECVATGQVTAKHAASVCYALSGLVTLAMFRYLSGEELEMNHIDSAARWILSFGKQNA